MGEVVSFDTFQRAARRKGKSIKEPVREPNDNDTVWETREGKREIIQKIKQMQQMLDGFTPNRYVLGGRGEDYKAMEDEDLENSILHAKDEEIMTHPTYYLGLINEYLHRIGG